jgi:CelD/BcsL family acetyltransferase involved in cellulose biosynthesis
MKRVSRSQLEEYADSWDAALRRDPAVDPHCSGSAWQLAYHDAFAPDRALWLAHEGADLVVLAERAGGPTGVMLEPLESMWGFASPLIGEGAARLLARALQDRPASLLLLGLSLDRQRLAPLVKALSGRYAARALPPTTRRVASLAGGVDGWLARRRASFRRNLRAAVRRVENAGIAFRYWTSVEKGELDTLYARVLEIEGQTWEAAHDNAADRDPMRSFYAGMWPRLAARGELRVLLAEHEGRPVGYVHGGVRGVHYRGLQVSFDDAMRPLSLGNVLQLEMIRRLCDEGVQGYDLGAQNEYKTRWAEPGLTTFGLLLQPLSATG